MLDFDPLPIVGIATCAVRSWDLSARQSYNTLGLPLGCRYRPDDFARPLRS